MIIKEARIRKNLSQEEIAQKCNISLRHYQNIESYKSIPNVIIALKIAKALDCKVEDLFKEKYYA